MFHKIVVIDGKDHILGRLASTVAKQLLSGQKIVIVRCEKVIKAGSLFRNKVLFGAWRQKKMVHNPKRFAQKQTSPSSMIWRAVRGMIPRLTSRGSAAMSRLKVYEGVPSPYDLKKKVIVTDALKKVCLRNHRKFCTVGELCSQVGWTKKNLIDRLEEKRIKRGQLFHSRKIEKVNLKRKALELPEVKAIQEKLKVYGY